MKRIVTLLSVCLIPFSFAFAQETGMRNLPPGPPPEMGPGNPEVRKQLEQIKIWQMTKDLNLPTTKAEKFFPLYNEYNSELSGITAQRRQVIRGLDSAIKKGSDDSEVKKQIQQFLNLDTQLADANAKFMQSLEGILTPVEVAKYIVFEQRFDREIRERVRMIMQQRMRGPNF